MHTPLPILTDKIEFPPPESALSEPNGLLAQGGDLTLPRLLKAYQMGIFPWYNEGDPILWWSPDPRCVLFLDDFKISRSFKKVLNKQPYQVRIDQDFDLVIRSCQKRNPSREDDETWITPAMKSAYTQLFQQGYAHCVACFDGENFVGGLYGISLGRIFFGESMVSLAPDASKIALNLLVNQLSEWGFQFIDCQMPSEHLLSLGAILLSRSEFLQKLSENSQHPLLNPCWQVFQS